MSTRPPQVGQRPDETGGAEPGVVEYVGTIAAMRIPCAHIQWRGFRRVGCQQCARDRRVSRGPAGLDDGDADCWPILQLASAKTN